MKVERFLVTPRDRCTWFVFNLASQNTYLVDLEDEVCTCDDFLYRQKDKKCETCKHMRLVSFVVGRGYGSQKIVVCSYKYKGISIPKFVIVGKNV